MEKAEIRKVVELAFVIVVTMAMLIYGLGKYMQFDNPRLVSKSISELTGMELMWAFYGYSKTYALLLGMAEITGGVLFFLRKTRVLGGVLLTGILTNVIIQDVIYGVNEGAMIAAIIYQLMILTVLWMNKNNLLAGIRAMLIKGESPKNSRTRQLLIVLSSIILAAMLKFIEFQLTH